MSINEGIYFIYSRFPDGRYIYKVGMSKNLERRLKEYPQNYEEVMSFECKDSSDMEQKLIASMNNLADDGITKCTQGKEYFESVDNKVKFIEQKIRRFILEIPEESPFTLKRLYTGRNMKIFGAPYNFRICNHHVYTIYRKDNVIGSLELICRDFHPSKVLVLHKMELFDKDNNDSTRKEILSIVENEFYWDAEYYEVSIFMYNEHKDFLKRNGFYLNIKFNDEMWLCGNHYDKNTYTIPLVFAFGYGSSEDRNKNPSDLFPAGRYARRQTIMCWVRGMKPEMTVKEYIYKRYENYMDVDPLIELSLPWIEIDDMHDSDGFFCICYKDDFLFKPTKLKYYRTTDALQLIYSSQVGRSSIARIDKIGDGMRLDEMMSKEYPDEIINYYKEAKMAHDLNNRSSSW